MIEFTIPGEAVAQGRPKFSTFNGKVSVRDPKKSRDHKTYVKYLAVDVAPEKLLSGMLEAEINVYMPIPKSFSKTKRVQALTGALRPTKKPDADNIAKAILDSLNHIIYEDDKQIVSLTVKKYYDEVPRTEVRIEEI